MVQHAGVGHFTDVIETECSPFEAHLNTKRRVAALIFLLRREIKVTRVTTSGGTSQLKDTKSVLTKFPEMISHADKHR